MTFVSCSIPEQFVNPLFEVFDGGDFVLSSYRDIEEALTQLRIFVENPTGVEEAKACLRAAFEIVGITAPIETGEMPDEDWKFAYRRHFKIEEIGRRLVTVPAWESPPAGDRVSIMLDPGLAFGTGKHETTRACLEYVDELSPVETFLDMGCGSGILSIAAAKLGCHEVRGFDVDQEAIDASLENAKKNGVAVEFARFALGRAGKTDAIKHPKTYDLVAANILGPLLIRFADEIVPYVGNRIILSGILSELYPDARRAYEARGLREISSKVIGEWQTGLFERSRRESSRPQAG